MAARLDVGSSPAASGQEVSESQALLPFLHYLAGQLYRRSTQRQVGRAVGHGDRYAAAGQGHIDRQRQGIMDTTPWPDDPAGVQTFHKHVVEVSLFSERKHVEGVPRWRKLRRRNRLGQRAFGYQTTLAIKDSQATVLAKSVFNAISLSLAICVKADSIVAYPAGGVQRPSGVCVAKQRVMRTGWRRDGGFSGMEH